MLFTPVRTPLPTTTPQESTAYYTTLQSEKNKIKIPGEFLGGQDGIALVRLTPFGQSKQSFMLFSIPSDSSEYLAPPPLPTHCPLGLTRRECKSSFPRRLPVCLRACRRFSALKCAAFDSARSLNTSRG